jgi:diguanylate cyclase (GGDEF)-like protein
VTQAKRRRASDFADRSAVAKFSWLAKLWIVVPIVLALAAAVLAFTYSSRASDVDHAGQLRYRSLLIRELSHSSIDDASRALTSMRDIRNDLRSRYSASDYFHSSDFEFFASAIDKGQQPSLESTMAHVASADRLTAELAASGRNYLFATLALFVATLAVLLVTIATLMRNNRRLVVAEKAMERLACTDGLTGLWNRRKLYTVLGDNDNDVCSVILVDIDHFKQINDEHGHGRGDDVLALFAEQLRKLSEAHTVADAKTISRGHQAFRYGGEEFAIVLEGVDLMQSTQLAERARQKLESTPLAGLTVTASFGVATLHPGDNPSSLLERADRSLYMAKRGGRNQVFVENLALRSKSNSSSGFNK